jgi:murein DD-endopeptidase MepM/ murein hydrolase activator NlpD
MSQIEYISTIESRITGSITELQTLNEELKTKKTELEASDKQLKELQASRQLEQGSLDAQSQAKESMLSDTKLTEAEYQNRLEAAVIEQQKLENQIAQLAKSARKGVLNDGKYTLLWPIGSRLITAGCRDPDYLSHFKLVHNAVDIATPQGTPMKAPADAYVLKVKFDGSTAYSYIMLDHGNGMVTVYGHVSGVNVTTGQFVPVGSVIGYTGGTPRSTGSGQLTTGPHLHFEVWLNGEARNPLAYLIG